MIEVQDNEKKYFFLSTWSSISKTERLITWPYFNPLFIRKINDKMRTGIWTFFFAIFIEEKEEKPQNRWIKG